MPRCPKVNEHLKLVAKLVGLTRIPLTTEIGRKTFVTLKLFQGVPQRMVMMATGHTTESSFNHYVGVDALKLLEQFQRHARPRWLNLRVWGAEKGGTFCGTGFRCVPSDVRACPFSLR